MKHRRLEKFKNVPTQIQLTSQFKMENIERDRDLLLDELEQGTMLRQSMCNEYYIKIGKLRDANDRLWAENNRLAAENNRLAAENNRLADENNRRLK